MYTSSRQKSHHPFAANPEPRYEIAPMYIGIRVNNNSNLGRLHGKCSIEQR